MSTFSELFEGGSKPRRLVYRRVITSSETVVVPAGFYDIIAIGTGGSGAKLTTSHRATGGGGAGWARDWGEFANPSSVVVTCGARAAGILTGASTSVGNTGGTTSVTGISSPISITGGGGGNFSAVADATVLGGTGGVASGGKIRANGSRGGNISGTGTTQHATGGGCVDLFLLGADRTRGGDITVNGSGTILSTGGGGVGGRGGDFILPTANSLQTSGGGAGGNAGDAVSASSLIVGPSILGQLTDPTDSAAIDILFTYPALRPIGTGSAAANASVLAPTSGGGSGAGGSPLGSPIIVPFGGSGGSVQPSTSTITGHCLYGGGSGGACGVGGQASGDGGRAIIIISVYQETI